MERASVELEGVSETTLWTLYHRAVEARRPDAVLADSLAVELVEAINFPFVERFGVAVRCVRPGLHEFTDGEPVEPFDFGDELPGGVVAHEVGAISPDETAFHIPAHDALALADGAVRWEPGGPLMFVPDHFMDEPEATKEGLRAAYRGLADLDFRHLLLAHGEPFVDSGREALAAFAG